MNTPAHCSSCGSTDYEDLHTGDQGYTACCNKRVCYGDDHARFGTPQVNVTACCWGRAEAVYAERGIEIPEGSYRLEGR